MSDTMALIECNFESEVLGRDTSMNVIVPQSKEKKEYPTLFLLHGLSDDHTTWLRRTSIERYVEPLELAVIMPDVGRSFYTDMAHGHPYWTFISEELPEIARSLFPLSSRREHNFVAGLSMGGYGAFKMVLRNPEKFSAGGSFSGALDIESVLNSEDVESSIIFGDVSSLRGTDKDIFQLVEDVSKSEGPKPLLYQCCGTEDFLYKDNIKFKDHAEGLSINLTYREGPGGHEWSFWDRKIENFLQWLPL